jgi:TRAP-type uncharacterized transport system fused permease subunit
MTEINGLPAHVLLVHAIVVLVPLTAILLLLCVFWSAARRRLVWPALALATIGLVLTPITTEAGEWLERRVDASALLQAHTRLGDTLLPWTVGLFVVSAAVAALHVLDGRRRRQARTEPLVRAATGAAGSSATTDLVAEPDPGQNPVPESATRPGWERGATIVVTVLAVIVAVGAVVEVYRIGESGAQAVWQGEFSQTATNGPPGGTNGSDSGSDDGG